MSYSYLVKIARYDGSVSVVETCSSEVEAQASADRRNAEYQSDIFYVERFDPKRLVWPSKPVKLPTG